MKYGILLLIFCSFVLTLTAQEPKFKKISVEEGLSQSTVMTILQDSRGFMWFGTSDGLNRYDGYNFRVYRHDPKDPHSISANSIIKIREDKNKRLWVATINGINCFNARTNSFKRYYHIEGNPNSLSSSLINTFAADHQGRIWIATNKGLDVLEPWSDRFYHVEFNSPGKNPQTKLYVYSLTVDQQGVVWASCPEGLFRTGFKQGGFFAEQVPLKLKHWNNEFVGVLHADKKGNLWMSTTSYTLLRYNITSGEMKTVTTELKNNNERVACFDMVEDRKGNLWLASYTGLFFYDVSTGKYTMYTSLNRNEGLSFNVLQGLYIDRSDNLWIGTNGGGINVLDLKPNKFHHYPALEKLLTRYPPFLIKSIYAEKNKYLWIGTYSQGLFLYDIQTQQLRQLMMPGGSTEPGKPFNVFSILRGTSGELWIGSSYGLFRYSESMGSLQKVSIPYLQSKTYGLNDIMCLREKGPGTLLLGTKVGLIEYQIAQKKSRLLYPAQYTDFLILSSVINAVYCNQDGSYWIGTYDGLRKLDKNGQVIWSSGSRSGCRLTSQQIKCLFRGKKGFLWVGTEDGLNKLDESGKLISEYHENDGLPNDFIYGIQDDAKGNLWISTNNGISRFSEWMPEGKKFRNYDLKDGLLSREFNTGAYFKDNSGTMYFGGTGGLNYFSPDSVRNNPHVPGVVITSIKVNDRNYNTETDAPYLEHLRLGPDQSIFSLSFSGLEFTEPGANQYAYKMEGFEEKWTYSRKLREVRYTNLPPGDYVFRVRASNSDGVWNSRGLALFITIDPPFWKTWWFRLVSTLLFVALLSLLIWYWQTRKLHLEIARLQQLQALEKERVRISKDMHDEIGASLTKVSLLSGMLLNGDKGGDFQKDKLEKIYESSQEVITKMDEIVWAINPKFDNLNSLIGYIGEFTDEFLEVTSIRHRLNLPDEIPDIPVSSELRHNIFLVVKETLNNIVKHAEASLVEISVVLQDKDLLVLIEDDGKGFDMRAVGAFSNGLNNMKKRMESLGCSYSIISMPGDGTVTRIQVRR